MSSQIEGETDSEDETIDIELAERSVETELLTPAELRCAISLDADDPSE